MKSGAYPARMMKPKYQVRKNRVAGITNALLSLTSSWNSGERSAATQSMSGRCPAPRVPPAGVCSTAHSPPRNSGHVGTTPGSRGLCLTGLAAAVGPDEKHRHGQRQQADQAKVAPPEQAG